MKHVSLLRLFLVLFNLSWISWTVFVHAEKSFESTSGESKTSVLGLNDTNGELRTTISEPHPPTNHTNTIGVVHHTSDNISESQSFGEVTSKKPVDKEKSVITERSLSSVISNGEGHSSLTTVRQDSSGIVIKTNERTGTFGSSNQLSISHGEVTTNAAYSMGELSDSGMNSQQSNHVDVNKESQGKISVTTSATHSTDESSVSRMNSGLNEHVSISKESQAKMSVTTSAAYSTDELSDSLMNSQQSNHISVSKEQLVKTSITTTSASYFRNESLVSDSGMNSSEQNDHVDRSKEQQSKTSVTTNAAYSMFDLSDSGMSSEQSNHINVSDVSSVTTNSAYSIDESSVSGMSSGLRDHVSISKEYQAKISVTPSAAYSMDGSSVSGMSSGLNDHVSVSKKSQAKISVTTSAAYSTDESSASEMTSERNNHVSTNKEHQAKTSDVSTAFVAHTTLLHFQSTTPITHFPFEAPAIPEDIKVIEIGSQSVNISWTQKGVVDNFSISVSDPAAKACWTSDNETLMTVWGFIDHLSTPGQLLTVTITALSGQLKSNGNRTKSFNTKPSKPGSLAVIDCHNNNLCIQWNQLGIFDSCYIFVNGSKAEISCWNSSNTETNNLTTVNCTVNHVFPSGSSTTLSVAVQSGPQSSDETKKVYVKEPSQPEGLRAVMVNTSMVCFSWNQMGLYDEFDIEIHSYQRNLTLLKQNVTGLYNDNRLWCVTDLLCPGAAYSLRVAAVSHGEKSAFQNLNFHPAVDSLVTCESQTNDSFKVSIQPDIGTDSCSNLSDIVRFKYNFTNQPVNNEPCSEPMKKSGVLNATHNVLSITGLIAGVTYQVKGWAVIDGIASKEKVINCSTKPNPPSGLRILNISNTSMMLNWTHPEGCVDDFFINCIGQNNSANDSKSVKGDVEVMCENLTSGALYNVKVGSRRRGDTGLLSSDAESLWFVTVPNRPSKVTVEKNFVDSLQLSVEYNNTKCTHFLFDVSGESNSTDSCNIMSHNITSLKSNTFYNISVYTISNHSQSSFGSQISVDSIPVSRWTLPLAVSNLSVTLSTVDSLILQWDQPDESESVHGIRAYDLSLRNSSDHVKNISLNCSSTDLVCRCKAMTYNLNNLTPNTNYTITIRAINDGGFSHEEIITKQTLALPPKPMSSDFSSLIVGIIVATIVIIILTAFLLVIVFRKKPKFAVPSARRPSNGSGFHNPTFTPDFCESMKPTPIPLDKFIEHLETLHRDTDHLFSSEYALLTELSPKLPQTAAEMEENRIKNRYSNILPFDHSRVKLIPLDDDDQGSDYINANYMPGYCSKREFIAAQGPMKSTVDDFWRMIWEQHVSTIVMVTNLQERGREKCAEYWPTDEEPVFYGDLQVQMKSESQLNYYIIRILDVKLGEKKRVVKHLHFISWPDFGCPENTTQLLDFVLGVRAHAPSQPLQGSGPILVHCSAGVGRTGTFILVDHLLQRMRTHRSLDVFGLVLDMRNYRCNMLQTEAQYVFAHECIKTAIERQMISSVRSSTPEDEEEDMYQNVRKKEEDGESMYQNVSRKDQLEEEEECAYINCTKNNGESVPV